MNSIDHIVSLLNAPWCGWTMLVLLLSVVLAEWAQPGIIRQTPVSLLARTDRTYKEAPSNFPGLFFITLFRIGTPAMALCLCFCSPGHTSFAAFGVCCGIIIGVMLIKWLCNRLIDYTFSLTRHFGAIQEHYRNIYTLAMVILYPMLLILFRWANPLAAKWVTGIVIVLFLLAWFFRAARTCFISPKAMLYLPAYFVTMELLPIAMIVYLSAQTIPII